ncbi:MAG: ATP-dependent DNA ligase [Candidatus Thorarchaeota archaeon]|nr:ATP-dependent DNA ligase [Candidatus Thorarchaeota archaeon]
MTDFVFLAEVLNKVSRTKKRNEKVALAGEFLRKVEIEEVSQAALYLSGKVFAESDQRTLNISWKGLMNALRKVVDFNDDTLSEAYDGDIGKAVAKILEGSKESRQSALFSEALSIASVSQTLSKIADIQGKGSVKEKQSRLTSLFMEASPRESRFLAALVLEDMRTGLSEGLLAESIAFAFGVDSTLVRRAWSFNGDLGAVAKLASEGGAKALRRVSVQVMRGLKPMLASPTQDLESLFESQPNQYSLELKLDGARVQIHKEGDEVSIFSRRLSDVTNSLPDIVQVVREKIKSLKVIIDGEVLAVDDAGRPFPFQVVMKRFGRTRDIEEAFKDTRLVLVLFDVILIDDIQLVDEPYSERRRRLEEIVPSNLLVERLVTESIDSAQAFFQRSQELGHEGLVAKKLDSPYIPGVRGKYWFKIKHTLDTLDLVIVAAEWGHGRRKDWLSDYHLAVRDEESGEFMIVGKTYKGFTDKEFQDITERLLDLKIASHKHIVQVRPEIVVEVIASEVQESPTYESGMALRFARISQIREDKGPMDAMTLIELREIFDKQFRFKAR